VKMHFLSVAKKVAAAFKKKKKGRERVLTILCVRLAKTQRKQGDGRRRKAKVESSDFATNRRESSTQMIINKCLVWSRISRRRIERCLRKKL